VAEIRIVSDSPHDFWNYGFQIKMFGFKVIVQEYCHSSSYNEEIVEIESSLMSTLIVLIYPCSC